MWWIIAMGCVPETLDLSEYQLDQLRPPPAELIDAEGDYQGGWYEDTIEGLNFDDSSAPEGDKKRFLHVAFDDPDYYVVGNVADMGSASNVALLVVEKATGRLHDVSLTGLFADNKVEVDPTHTRFEDPTTGSLLELSPEGGLIVDLHAEQLDLVGTASPAFALPFIQVTPFHEGHGSYQIWGNVVIEEMLLHIDGEARSLQAGSPGGYDRTAGHQRHEQNWNWFSVSGTATRQSTGELVPFALTWGKDRAEARPRVEALKYPTWAGEDYGKVDEVDFAYQKDPETAETGDWSITGPGVDITFRPVQHRRDLKGEAWLAETDFNQYYGEASGTFTLKGELYSFEEHFAVCEDSLIRL
jgi:Protein of unknown function (DUF2804)